MQKRFWKVFLLLLLATSFSPAHGQQLLPGLGTAESEYEQVFFDDFRYADARALLHDSSAVWHSGHTWQKANGTLRYAWKADSVAFDSICDNINPDKFFAYAEEDVTLQDDPDDPSDRVLALAYNYHNTPISPATNIRFYKTSGLLEHNTLQAYGIYEIRAKVPRSDGLLAAFWLWGPGGEIDGFETIFMQYKRNGRGERDYFCTVQPQPSLSVHYAWKKDPSEAFHTYHIAWTPTHISWFIDGFEIRKEDRKLVGGKLNLVLSAHYMWSCAAPGVDGRNDYCQPKACPPPNDPFLIDYIKIYRPKPAAATVAAAWPPYTVTKSQLNTGQRHNETSTAATARPADAKRGSWWQRIRERPAKKKSPVKRVP